LIYEYDKINHKQPTNNSKQLQTTDKQLQTTDKELSNMVCKSCNGAFTTKHNSRTCPLNTNPNLCAQTSAPKPVKKTFKPLEGLAGCKNIFKEPKVVKAKKVSKPLEGLAGCKNIFKEPKVVKARKATRSEIRVSKALLKTIRSSGHLTGVGILSL